MDAGGPIKHRPAGSISDERRRIEQLIGPLDPGLRPQLCEQRVRSLEYGGCFVHWHREKTCAILDGMCYKRAEEQVAEQHDGFVLIRGW